MFVNKNFVYLGCAYLSESKQYCNAKLLVYYLSNFLLLTAVAQFTAKTKNLEKSTFCHLGLIQ